MQEPHHDHFVSSEAMIGSFVGRIVGFVAVESEVQTRRRVDVAFDQGENDQVLACCLAGTLPTGLAATETIPREVGGTIEAWWHAQTW